MTPHQVRVLCIHGSPRGGGNTDLLLDAFGEGAERRGAEVRHLYVRSLSFRPCNGCGACSETGECVFEDDMVSVYEAVDRAHVLAVGAPVYFLGLPALLKGLIDRFQCRWSRRYLLDVDPGPERPGAMLSAAGASFHSVFTCAQKSVEAFFDVLGVACRTNLLYENVDDRQAIRSHPVALAEAREAGSSLVELASNSSP